MKITDYRDNKGKYKKRSKLKKIIKWMFWLGLIILIVSQVDLKKTPKISEPKTDSELNSIMQEEAFKKETMLRAQTLKMTREKEEEEKRHADAVAAENARYEANSSRIEGELQRIRQEELALGQSFN
jgi:hypothetical protein